MDFLYCYNFSSVVTLYFLLCSSPASPDLLWSLSSYTFGFIFESATPEICRSFCILCLLKSLSPSATRSTDLHVFSHSLRNYQFHHYLYLQFSTFSAFYCSHLQACFPYESVNAVRAELCPYSAFYLSSPLKCLLNPREKTKTGSHHNNPYRAGNVWTACSLWPPERYVIKRQKDTLHPQPPIRLLCSSRDAASGSSSIISLKS